MLGERIHSFDIAGNRIHFNIDQVALLGVLESSVFESMRNQVNADAGAGRRVFHLVDRQRNTVDGNRAFVSQELGKLHRAANH